MATNILKNLGAFAFAITLAVSVGEGTLRIVNAVKPQYDIEMLRYATQMKQPQWTTSSDGSQTPTFRHKPNARAKLMGVDIRTNQFGLRDDEVAPNRRPKVLVLGDSITMGWGVSAPNVLDRIAEQELKTAFPGIEIINAGIGNYNAASMAYLYQDLSRKIAFDAVVVYLAVNDIEEDPTIRNSAFVAHSYLAAFLSIRWSYLRLRFSGNHNLFDYYTRSLTSTHGSWKHNLVEILALQKRATEQQQQLLFILQPDLLDLRSDSRMLGLLEALGEQLRDYGIQVYNVLDAIPAPYRQDGSRRLWVAPDDRHYNGLGHQIMGHQLAQILSPRLKSIPDSNTVQ